VARDWPDGRGLTLAMVVASALVVPVTFGCPTSGRSWSAPLALAGGLVVALFSSAIPYTFEIAALAAPARGHVRRADEPRAGDRRDCRLLLLGQVLRPADLIAIASSRSPAPAPASRPGAWSCRRPGRARIGLTAPMPGAFARPWYRCAAHEAD
jgi:hypothetical protein